MAPYIHAKGDHLWKFMTVVVMLAKSTWPYKLQAKEVATLIVCNRGSYKVA